MPAADADECRLQEIFPGSSEPEDPQEPARRWRRIEHVTIHALTAALHSQIIELSSKGAPGNKVDLNDVKIVIGAGLRKAGGWRVDVSCHVTAGGRVAPLALARRGRDRGWQFTAVASWGMSPAEIAAAILDTVDPGHPTVAEYRRSEEGKFSDAWLDRYTADGIGSRMDRHEVQVIDGIPVLAWAADAERLQIHADADAATVDDGRDEEAVDLIEYA